jgi:molybdopterin synthase catalytic subunit
MIALSKNKIDIDKVIEAVASDQAGAIDVFIGTVRNRTKNKKVLRLEFEAYESMAIKELEKIKERAFEKWPILKIAIVHAIGVLEIGAVPVVIAVSTPHRKDAFEACQFVIDELKKTVPIWKKEFFEDGEVWVSSHP